MMKAVKYMYNINHYYVHNELEPLLCNAFPTMAQSQEECEALPGVRPRRGQEEWMSW